MRITHAVLGIVAASLAFASPAFAQARIAPITFSPEFQTALEEDIGTREGEYLRNVVASSVTRALARRGVYADNGAVTIEITILDADPNAPTQYQTRQNLSLDSMRSFSIGGAELRAVLRGANGEVLSEVEHRRYNHSIGELLYPPGTWTEAHRSINQFARKVADAYVAIR